MGVCTSHDDTKIARRQQLQSLTYETADELTYNFDEAKVLKVYDGDTLTIAAWFDNGFKRFSVRIFGIDCDEMRGGTSTTRENAVRAKKYVERLVLNKIVKIQILNNKLLDGKKMREKFGRLLAKITTPDGHDLGDELFIAGLARRYYGGHKDHTPLKPNVDISIGSDDHKQSSDTNIDY